MREYIIQLLIKETFVEGTKLEEYYSKLEDRTRKSLDKDLCDALDRINQNNLRGNQRGQIAELKKESDKRVSF